jgi:hypothetical protein
MKTNAEKSSTATSAAAMQAAKQPFFAKKGGGDFFAPAVQMKMAVSKPGDKLEQEADRMADNVMRMPSSGKEEKLQRAPDEKLRKKENDKIQKAAVPEEKVQKKEDDKLQKKETEKLQKAPASEEKLLRKGNDRAPSVDANLQSAIQSRSGGGQPLSGDIRSYMEPRFNADFSKVRVHSDQESASLSNQLRARAFTHQNNIFFSRNQYQPGSSEGRQLLAHELTHTIQQGHAVQRSPLVSTTTTPPTVQRLFGIDLDPRSFFASAAAAIPGFTMLTVVIGSNPITGASVDRTPGNILRGAIEMIPVAGALISQALDNHGIFEKVSVWASQQFNTLSDIGSSIRQSIADFISNFDILSPGAMLERGKQLITEPIARIKNFAGNLKDGIVTFIKEAILKPIAAFAKANVPNGYDLLCAVLGKDPISGEPVPQTAENLIAPFMKLIGQEEVWENMKKSNAIGRAWAWFQKALSTVKGFVQELPTLFINAFKTLEIIDIVLIPRAFGKLVGVFGSFAGRFISWAGTAVWNLLEIIFDAVSPGALGYIKKTGSAIKSIFQNPLPFVGNLVKAAKQGFLNFATNIGGHLKAGLIDWLTGSLSGVYIPKVLNLAELGKFALSILGITWTQIRGKIVKVLGPNGEKIMQGLETGFDIVVALVKGGPAAAWELIKEKLADLKDTVISGIVGFVTETVVKKAIPKLIAMFIPGAGFISAIISIYDTVMVFVEKISKIIQVVTAFIDSIVTIAAGNITAAANRVESILGGLLSLAISFLAGFLGLGKITDKIKAVIEKVRLTVDKAIDAVIGWIVGKAKKLFSKLFGKGNKPDERTEKEKQADLAAAIEAAGKILVIKGITPAKVKTQLSSIKSTFRLTTIDLIHDGGDKYHVNAVINPSLPGAPVKLAAGKFKLAPGGYLSHEKNIVSLPSGKQKEVHLVSKHGPGVQDSELKGRLQSVLQLFLLTRTNKISIQQGRIDGANKDIALMTSLVPAGGVPTPNQQKKIDRANTNIAEANNLIVTYRALNQTDKAQVFNALNDWKVSPMPTDKVTIFASDALMDQSVDDALIANQSKIDTAFTDTTGSSKPEGTPLKITHAMGGSVGTGWEFDQNMNIVQIGYALKGVEFHLLVSAPFEFKIETGYATP